MEFNLKKILKALLFSTSEWLSIKDIQAVITRYHKEADLLATQKNDSEKSEDENQEEDSLAGEQELIQEIIAQVPTLLTATQIREAMDAIANELVTTGEVYTLLQGPAGWRMSTTPAYSQWVRLLRDDPRPQRLSQAALETLAIISYRQPVTRAEIESIRGVNADGALNRLLDRELIYVVGRADLPGRPIQYGSTEKFLEFVGLSSLDELPASDVLSPNQISEWIKKVNNPELFDDQDMGLSPSVITKEDSTENENISEEESSENQ